MDYYGFYTGREFRAHEYLGAHVEEGGVRFCTAGLTLLMDGESAIYGGRGTGEEAEAGGCEIKLSLPPYSVPELLQSL